MSVRITEDTPEPSEDGIYIVTRNDGSQFPLERLDDEFPWAMPLNEDSSTWQEMLAYWAGLDFSIESLAAHDARIRREALELSDEELGLVGDSCIDSGVLASPYAIREGLKAVADHREASDVRRQA